MSGVTSCRCTITKKNEFFFGILWRLNFTSCDPTTGGVTMFPNGGVHRGFNVLNALALGAQYVVLFVLQPNSKEAASGRAWHHISLLDLPRMVYAKLVGRVLKLLWLGGFVCGWGNCKVIDTICRPSHLSAQCGGQTKGLNMIETAPMARRSLQLGSSILLILKWKYNLIYISKQ
jgi:hypothetical protein